MEKFSDWLKEKPEIKDESEYISHNEGDYMGIKEEFREFLSESDKLEKIIAESGDSINLNKLFNIHYYGHMRKFPMITSHDNSGKAPSMKALEKAIKGKNPDNVTIGPRSLSDIKGNAPGILYVTVSQSTGKITPKWLFRFGERYNGYEFITAKDYRITDKDY